jgi:protein gp37
MGNPRYKTGFNLTVHNDLLTLPLKWKQPRKVFVNSMSDLFHDSVPDDFIKRAFDTMVKCHWHSFQVLTKRAERLEKLSRELPWPDNVWQGVSIELAEYGWRVRHLQKVPAVIRFLSIEPLLGSIPNLPLEGIDWVIVGGESGPYYRKINPSWVREIREQCIAAKIPFFFKQWGGFNSKAGGRVLDGKIWNEMPAPNRQTALV